MNNIEIRPYSNSQIKELVQNTTEKIYFLDEWDANLDDMNKQIISKLLAELSNTKCIIEVRHRTDFETKLALEQNNLESNKTHLDKNGTSAMEKEDQYSLVLFFLSNKMSRDITLDFSSSKLSLNEGSLKEPLFKKEQKIRKCVIQ